MSVPQPPTQLAMPKTAELVFTVFIFIPLAVCLVIAIRQALRGQGGALLLCCIAGGAFAAFFEPIVDVLGMCYLKEKDAIGTFTVLGRTVPLYICFVYPWYVGGLGYLAYRVFDRGITMRSLFALWAVVGVVDIALEMPGIVLHTYTYYGKQPFNLGGFPLWWAFVNPVMPMIAGALIYKLRPHLPGWKLLAVVACIPIADGVANAAAGWPVWIALNQTHPSYVWTYLAALVTLGLSLFCVWIIGLVVARPAEAPAVSRVPVAPWLEEVPA
jgi:hypothetical protein